VEINNQTYYIDTVIAYLRDDAKTICESVNMALLSFEGDQQKWLAVNNWILENGTTLTISNTK